MRKIVEEYGRMQLEEIFGVLKTFEKSDFNLNLSEKYCSHIVEAHHIDYFVSSLNNDANNQLMACPNHHSIIHDVNPVFDRKRLLYIYKNGVEEKLVLNQHIR